MRELIIVLVVINIILSIISKNINATLGWIMALLAELELLKNNK